MNCYFSSRNKPGGGLMFPPEKVDMAVQHVRCQMRVSLALYCHCTVKAAASPCARWEVSPWISTRTTCTVLFLEDMQCKLTSDGREMGWMWFPPPTSDSVKVWKSHLKSNLSISVDIHKSVKFCSTNTQQAVLTCLAETVQPHVSPLVKELRRSRGQRRRISAPEQYRTLPCILGRLAHFENGAALREAGEVDWSWRCEQHLAAWAASFT